MKYLYQCVRSFIQETHASGQQLWASLEGQAEFVLTHPNGWEGAQQAQMRKAAIHGGLIRDRPDEHARIHFVTEGEASLHYCVGNNYSSDVIKVVISPLFNCYCSPALHRAAKELSSLMPEGVPSISAHTT
jgi:cytosine/adenosine deaminase-related metal-dependent hydrolase